ncbi:H-NS histone family protein [Cupriavidus cauae]|uniref:H-NS histone family protein n=2 Tax=Cupriavidus cauae TaxID=2608999 RepID=A0A5M8AH10_9BURK|nr:H-NS histone family protein [Cupriavidus cauae]
MSEFDEARLAAAAWVRAQMDRYGLSLDDLVAAGCFSGASRIKRGRAAAADAAASSPASADSQMSATPAAFAAAPAASTATTAASASTAATASTASAAAAGSAASTAKASSANEPAPPQPAGVLYRNALGQCWDGTGEMPDWLQRAVNAGQTPEFYRVS